MPPRGEYDSEVTAEEWGRGWCSRLTCNVYRAIGEGHSPRAQTQHRVVAAAVALMVGGLKERVLPPAAVAAGVPVSERGVAETMLRLKREGWLHIVGDRRRCWRVSLGPRWEQTAAEGGTWSKALRIGAMTAATELGATPAQIDALVLHSVEAGGSGRHEVSLEQLSRTYGVPRPSLSRATSWLAAKGLVSYAGSRRVRCASGVWAVVRHYEPLRRGASHARENLPIRPIFFSYLRAQTTPQTEVSSPLERSGSPNPVREQGPQCATRGCLNRTRPKPPRKERAASFDVWCKPCWQMRRWSGSWRRAGGLAAQALGAEAKGGFAGVARAWYLSDGAQQAMQRAAEQALRGLGEGERAVAALGAGRKSDAVCSLRGARSKVSSVAAAVRSALEEIAAAEAVQACEAVAVGLGSPAEAFERYRRAKARAGAGAEGLCGRAGAARGLLGEVRYVAADSTPPARRSAPAQPQGSDGGRALGEVERRGRVAEAREVLRRARLEDQRGRVGGGWPPS